MSAAPDGLVPVCRLDRLLPERGAAVLLGDQQIALFRVVDDGADVVFAVSHWDPFAAAHVMARGIVGSSGERVTVASPMYKQVFDLSTGECLTDPDVRLPVWETRVEEGVVLLSARPVDGPSSAVSPEPTPVEEPV